MSQKLHNLSINTGSKRGPMLTSKLFPFFVITRSSSARQPAFVFQLCVSRGLSQGPGGLRAVGQPAFLTHGFQKFAQHVQPLQKHTNRKTSADSSFHGCDSVRLSQLGQCRSNHNSLFFFVGIVSQTLRLRKCHCAFFKSVLGISPGGAGEVHERAQLPPSNSHSDTHQQACMAPLDRLMVVGGGTWVVVLRSGQL